MIEIAGGIILAVIILWIYPPLMTITLHLIPPTIGIVVGAVFGHYMAGGGGMLAGLLVGLIGGIWLDIRITRELDRPWT